MIKQIRGSSAQGENEKVEQSDPDDPYELVKYLDSKSEGESTIEPNIKGEWDMIRLVTILPGNFDDAIYCEITHNYITHHQGRNNNSNSKYPLGSKRVYEALSYTWGTSIAKETIHVNGKKFRVRKNLEIALRYLRHITKQRTLWIDAICINQFDIEERNTQVRRMIHIYREASCVLVWLGPETNNSNLAFDVLEAVGGRESEMDWNSRSLIGAGMKEVLQPRDPSKLKGPEDLNIEEWQALTGLFLNHGWWTRMWVVQEITYPTYARLLCGHRSIT